MTEDLDARTVPGVLWLPEKDAVRCVACGHRCRLAPGRRGVCQVRFNRDGALRVPFGYVAGAQCDPVEKKPFFHLLPGSTALTFGMLGCDFHCAFCQNWSTSQVLRDDAARGRLQPTTPEQLVGAAHRAGARLVVSSYNEPLITAEWAVAVFQAAREAGLLCAFVSNGNATPEVLDYLRPWLAAYKVDLKCFRDKGYRAVGGRLDRVTDSIQRLHRLGIWVEVVTLIVPGYNDDPDELQDLAAFLASVSPDLPWHVTAFHPDYRLQEPRPTSVEDLVRAAAIGREAGLNFVYAGNLPGRVDRAEDTFCPGCGALLVERRGFTVTANRLEPDGACPKCGHNVPGIWDEIGARRLRTGLPAGTASLP